MMIKCLASFLVLNMILLSTAENIADEVRYPGIFPDNYGGLSRADYLPWLLKRRINRSRGYNRNIPGYGSYYHPWQLPGSSRGYRYRSSRY